MSFRGEKVVLKFIWIGMVGAWNTVFSYVIKNAWKYNHDIVREKSSITGNCKTEGVAASKVIWHAPLSYGFTRHKVPLFILDNPVSYMSYSP